MVAVMKVDMKGGHATAKGEAQPVRKKQCSSDAGPLGVAVLARLAALHRDSLLVLKSDLKPLCEICSQ